jgi:hypothetical protein
VIPAAVLVALMIRVTRSLSPQRSVAASLVTWGGTVLAPLSALLFGHVLAATMLYAAFYLLWRSPDWRASLGAGLLSGITVATEYTAALGVIVLLAWLLIKRRDRVRWFLVGGLGPAVLLAAYNYFAFGSPLVLSYQFNAFHEVVENARPLLHMFAGVETKDAVALFLGGRGLLIATPIVVIAVIGLVGIIRSHRDRLLGGVGLAMVGIFIAIPLLWENPWGGDSPGPRYLAAALPFLAPGVAYAWERWRIVTRFAAVWSCLAMALATLTSPTGIPADAPSGVDVWIGWALEGRWVRTIPEWVLHNQGLGRTTYLLAVVATAIALRMASWNRGLAMTPP